MQFLLRKALEVSFTATRLVVGSATFKEKPCLAARLWNAFRLQTGKCKQARSRRHAFSQVGQEMARSRRLDALRVVSVRVDLAVVVRSQLRRLRGHEPSAVGCVAYRVYAFLCVVAESAGRRLHLLCDHWVVLRVLEAHGRVFTETAPARGHLVFVGVEAGGAALAVVVILCIERDVDFVEPSERHFAQRLAPLVQEVRAARAVASLYYPQ